MKRIADFIWKDILRRIKKPSNIQVFTADIGGKDLVVSILDKDIVKVEKNNIIYINGLFLTPVYEYIKAKISKKTKVTGFDIAHLYLYIAFFIADKDFIEKFNAKH